MTATPDPQAGLIDACSEDELLDAIGPSDADDRRRQVRENDTTPPPATARSAPPRTIAARLVEIVTATVGLELFHTPEGVGYAALPVDGHRATLALQSTAFRQWIGRAYYTTTAAVPNAQAVADALGVLDARAQFDGDTRAVWLRVAGDDGRIVLDLGGPDWAAVEITAAGWRVVEMPGVHFRRARGQLALPGPVRGRTLDLLRPLLNIDHRASPDDWHLLVAALVAMLRPRGPYPVLGLNGEQGSAKSTAARVVRGLVDPATVALRALPHDERDLAIAAHNGWLLTFDNVSHLKPWMSDALCRLATGGGFATRQLYTDNDEALFDAQRPVILTGIEDVAHRDDLRDRAIVLTLPPVTDARRCDEHGFWTDYAEVRPFLLGALCDVVSGALQHLGTVQIAELPRLADFARWITAAEPALGWEPGTAVAAYVRNRQASAEDALEGTVFGVAVRRFIDTHQSWTGTAGELLAALNTDTDEGSRREGWPRTPRAAAGMLRRQAVALKRLGYTVVHGGPRRTVQLKAPSDKDLAPLHGPHGVAGDFSAEEAAA